MCKRREALSVFEKCHSPRFGQDQVMQIFISYLPFSRGLTLPWDVLFFEHKFMPTLAEKNLFASLCDGGRMSGRTQLGYISLSRKTHSEFVKGAGKKSRLR